jgi:branched-chain amino acid aminotransferase
MTEPKELVMYVNGRFLPYSRGMAALQQGDMQAAGGFYDAERTFNGRVFELRLHLERLYRGLEFSQIDPGLSLDEMESLTLEVLEANRPLLASGDEFTVTQMVSLGQPPSPGENPSVNVVIYCQPLDFTSFAGNYVRGVRLVTPVTHGVPGPQSGGKEGGLQALQLMTGQDGRITECRGANFMFVRDGRIKLPDRRNVLPGVSMHMVLELTESLGLAVDEDDYSTYDVYMADEAFISSTRYCMLPVATLNGYRLGNELPGPVTLRLLGAWRNMVGMDFVRQALEHLPLANEGTASG